MKEPLSTVNVHSSAPSYERWVEGRCMKLSPESKSNLSLDYGTPCVFHFSFDMFAFPNAIQPLVPYIDMTLTLTSWCLPSLVVVCSGAPRPPVVPSFPSRTVVLRLSRWPAARGILRLRGCLRDPSLLMINYQRLQLRHHITVQTTYSNTSTAAPALFLCKQASRKQEKATAVLSTWLTELPVCCGHFHLLACVCLHIVPAPSKKFVEATVTQPFSISSHNYLRRRNACHVSTLYDSSQA